MHKKPQTHSGEYHDSFEKCNFIKCGWGLGIRRLGKPHWSCCYNTMYNSVCPVWYRAVVDTDVDEDEGILLWQFREEQGTKRG